MSILDQDWIGPFAQNEDILTKIGNRTLMDFLAPFNVQNIKYTLISLPLIVSHCLLSQYKAWWS